MFFMILHGLNKLEKRDPLRFYASSRETMWSSVMKFQLFEAQNLFGLGLSKPSIASSDAKATAERPKGLPDAYKSLKTISRKWLADI